MELKKIMINKGDVIKCTETLKVNGRTYFLKGDSYISPEINCLTNMYGEDNFVSQQYLRYFEF